MFPAVSPNGDASAFFLDEGDLCSKFNTLTLVKKEQDEVFDAKQPAIVANPDSELSCKKLMSAAEGLRTIVLHQLDLVAWPRCPSHSVIICAYLWQVRESAKAIRRNISHLATSDNAKAEAMRAKYQQVVNGAYKSIIDSCFQKLSAEIPKEQNKEELDRKIRHETFVLKVEILAYLADQLHKLRSKKVVPKNQQPLSGVKVKRVVNQSIAQLGHDVDAVRRSSDMPTQPKIKSLADRMKALIADVYQFKGKSFDELYKKLTAVQESFSDSIRSRVCLEVDKVRGAICDRSEQLSQNLNLLLVSNQPAMELGDKLHAFRLFCEEMLQLASTATLRKC